jgi:copper chaperone CopZ
VCAHAVRVSLKSVSGVESVGVDLEKGLASVTMKPGNSITLKQLNDAIAKNGFTMKQSTATIAGRIAVTKGKTVLQVSSVNDELELVPDSPAVPIVTALAGKSVVVEGTVPEAGKGKSPDSIRYRSIKDEDPK